MPSEHLTARGLMTADVVSVPPGIPVTALARLLADRGISSVPVTNVDGKLLGIVTEADLLRRLAGAEDAPIGWLRGVFGDADRQAVQYARTHGLEAQDIMTRDLVTVGPDASAEHCAHLMEERRIKRLPVTEDGRLIGIISRADLLAALLDPPETLGSAKGHRDASIRAALRKEMRSQPWADSLYIFADVKDGVVTLHGFVRSDAIRRALRVLASRVEGVQRVDDHLEDMPVPLPGDVL